MIRSVGRSQGSATSIALMAVLGFILPATGRSEERFAPPDCGVSSLYILLDLTGRRVELKDLYEALPPRHEDGYSLLELRNASRRCGLDLWGGRLSRDHLPLDRPVIAYYNVPGRQLGHYVVLVPVGTTGTMVEMIDPPYHPRIVDYTAVMPAGSSLRILYPLEFWETRVFVAAGVGAFLVLVLAAISLFLRRQTRRNFAVP